MNFKKVETDPKGVSTSCIIKFFDIHQGDIQCIYQEMIVTEITIYGCTSDVKSFFQGLSHDFGNRCRLAEEPRFGTKDSGSYPK